MADEARAIVDRLGLARHPEGGWYRETWRLPGAPGERSAATAILFLLEAGQVSHWHRVDATETWLWHAGDRISLATAPDDSGPVAWVTLGGKVLAGETPQAIVPAGHWQSARAAGGWALVSCVVVPGFDFAGFVLAPAGWVPGT